MNSQNLAAPRFSAGWFYAIGLLLIIIGAICIAAPVVSTMVSLVIFGWLLVFSGILKAIYSFRFWKQEWSGFFLYLLGGILYLVVGFLIIYNPVPSVAALTLLLAVFFLVLGLLHIVAPIAMHLRSSAWIIINGIISVILGILILAHWPSSAFWVIGLFIGIDLIFSGITLISLGFAGKRLLS